MLKKSERTMRLRAAFGVLVIILAATLFVSGCATTETVQQTGGQEAGITVGQGAPTEGNLITGIKVEETAQSIVVTIVANHAADYTLAEPPLQQAKVLYFPDSGLALEKTDYSVENEIISFIQAAELVKGGPSKIVIAIKKPGVACEAHRGDSDNILRVVFPRDGAGSSGASEIVAEEIAAESVQPETGSMSQDKESTATRVEKIEVLEEADRVSVKIKADASVKTYKSFTLTGPPRIVLDVPGLTSPYKKEQRLAVKSDMVQQIRHFSHQGYLRVVLEVKQPYLSDFKVASVADGLMVYVGNTAALAQAPAEQQRLAQAEAAEAAPAVEKPVVQQPVTGAVMPPTGDEGVAIRKNGRPALVNNIDFIEEQGKSTIRIGTTHPVKYDLIKTGNNKLRLTLDGADILSHRQRPLITTRFDSAVNSIIPLQTEAMKTKGLSVFDINLREEVGYHTERNGNLIMVHFEPSTVAPDPAEKVVIPTEHAIMTEAAASSAPAAEGPMEKPAEEIMAAAVAPAAAPAADAEAPEAYADEDEAMDDEASSEEPTEPDSLSSRKKKVYTGEPIALDFYKTDIRNVIRILKDVSGKNFAIDEDVKGSVTLSFINPVPWDQVLDLILEMNNLGMVERDEIIRIATKETILKQKEADRASMAAEQELKVSEDLVAPLVTEYFSISYSNAETQILPHIEALLTPERGSAKVDTRTKQIIMTDIREKVEKAREVIEKIDKVTPQVMIKARIVETNSNFSREFGAEWGINNAPGAYRNNLGGTLNYDMAMNNPAAAATNTMGINFARIIGTPFSLDAKLSLMESNGQVRIVSSPRIVTLDNTQATISQGQEIPYTTVDDGEADTQFKDADLKLQVTPRVTPDNRVFMTILIEEKEVGEVISGDEPPLNTKMAQTELLVNDGDTIVIGGIIQETDREAESGIPYISKIPLLGHLFKSQSRENEKTELVIFITPTIVRLD